jgi:hypothetical protein
MTSYHHHPSRYDATSNLLLSYAYYFDDHIVVHHAVVHADQYSWYDRASHASIEIVMIYALVLISKLPTFSTIQNIIVGLFVN